MAGLRFAILAVAVVALVVGAVSASASSPARHGPSTSRSFFLTGKVPAGWTMQEKVTAEEEVSVVFAVRRKNLDRLEDFVLRVSDPKDPLWGKHMTVDEVNALTSDWEATGTVMSWLLASDVPAASIVPSRGGNFVQVTMPASRANAVLQASFHYFRHEATGMRVKRTPIYRLPAAVSSAVDFVSSSTLYPQARPRPARRPLVNKAGAAVNAAAGAGDIPPGYVQPSTINKVYGVPSNTVATPRSTQAVYESLGQSYAPADLKLFQSTFSLPAQDIAKVIGPNSPSDCASEPDNCVEADLDVEYLIAVAQGAPTTFWSIANSDQQPFLDWIVAVGQSTNPPLVHSVSYGEIEQLSDPTVVRRFCSEVQTLAARGISVMIASGDDGVANFQARGDPSHCGFNPSYPAVCPFVTAVGATMGPENGEAEVACTSSEGGQITSGGGFSTLFSAPSYQQQAVQTYLQNGPNLPPTSQFAEGGRGYPDVALLGHNYVTAVGGQLSAGSGTSASTPVFAGLITLINAQRIEAGKSPLGFLNPVLYQLAVSNPSVFNDITSGTNNCSAGDSTGEGQAPTCCEYGFTASVGWDPVTGLGSVNFQALSDALLALP